MRFVCFGLLLLAPPVFAQVAVPIGTRIPVVILTNLSSKTAKQGEKVKFEVDSDVVVAGKTVFAKGAAVTGTVTDAKPAGHFGHAGVLSLEIDSAMAVDNQYIWLTATMSDLAQQTGGGSGLKDQAAANAAKVADMVPGGSVVTGLFQHGDDIEYKAHTRMSVFTATYANIKLHGTPTSATGTPTASADSAQPVGVAPAGIALFEAEHTWDMALANLAASHGSKREVRELGKRLVRDDSILRDQGRELAKAANTPVAPINADDQTRLTKLLTDLQKQHGEDFDQAVLRQLADFEQGFLDGVDDDSSTQMGQLLTLAASVWKTHLSQGTHLIKVQVQH